MFFGLSFLQKKYPNFARQMDTDLFSPHILCSSGHHTAFGFSARPSPCYDLKQNLAFHLHTVFCPPVHIARSGHHNVLDFSVFERFFLRLRQAHLFRKI